MNMNKIRNNMSKVRKSLLLRKMWQLQVKVKDQYTLRNQVTPIVKLIQVSQWPRNLSDQQKAQQTWLKAQYKHFQTKNQLSHQASVTLINLNKTQIYLKRRRTLKVRSKTPIGTRVARKRVVNLKEANQVRVNLLSRIVMRVHITRALVCHLQDSLVSTKTNIYKMT